MAFALAATTNGGETWQAIPIPSNGQNVAKQGTWFGNNGNPLSLIFQDANDGWYYDWQLFQTHGGGKTWHAEPTKGAIVRMGEATDRIIPPKPCDMYPTILSPVDTQEIWMGCGFAQGAGSGISAVFESPDGGRSWECIDLPGEHTCNLWVPANPDAVQPTGSLP